MRSGMNKYRFVCYLCWQWFDEMPQHDQGSFVDGERVNGHCPGDIRYTSTGEKALDPDFVKDCLQE